MYILQHKILVCVCFIVTNIVIHRDLKSDTIFFFCNVEATLMSLFLQKKKNHTLFATYNSLISILKCRRKKGLGSYSPNMVEPTEDFFAYTIAKQLFPVVPFCF